MTTPMTDSSDDKIKSVIASVADPHTGATLGDGKSIGEVSVTPSGIEITVSLG